MARSTKKVAWAAAVGLVAAGGLAAVTLAARLDRSAGHHATPINAAPVATPVVNATLSAPVHTAQLTPGNATATVYTVSDGGGNSGGGDGVHEITTSDGQSVRVRLAPGATPGPNTSYQIIKPGDKTPVTKNAVAAAQLQRATQAARAAQQANQDQ